MPRQWIEVVICSLCEGKSTDLKSPVGEWVAVKLEISGEGIWELDVCPGCRFKPGLNELVVKGIRVKTGKKATTRGEKPAAITDEHGPALQCPECQKVFASSGGMAQHRSKAHGVVAATAAELAARGSGSLKCKVAGCDFGATAPQGLGAHMRSKHPDEFWEMQREKEAKKSA